jgi:hypothetical protein
VVGAAAFFPREKNESDGFLTFLRNTPENDSLFFSRFFNLVQAGFAKAD